MPNTEHKTTEGEIKEIWERLTAGEASIKSAHHRINGLENLAKSVNSLAMSTNRLATETKALREDYTSADARLLALEEVPKSRYETIIKSVLSAVIGAVVGFLVSGMVP